MIYMININTEIFLRSVKDLNKLKLLVEVNNLDRPMIFMISFRVCFQQKRTKYFIINLISIDIWLEKKD